MSLLDGELSKVAFGEKCLPAVGEATGEFIVVNVQAPPVPSAEASNPDKQTKRGFIGLLL